MPASHSRESRGLRHRPALSPRSRLAPPSAALPGGRGPQPSHGLSAPSKKLDFVDFPTIPSARRVRRSATAHHTPTADSAGGAGSCSAASSRAARFTLPPTYIDLTNMYGERRENFVKICRILPREPRSSQGSVLGCFHRLLSVPSPAPIGPVEASNESSASLLPGSEVDSPPRPPRGPPAGGPRGVQTPLWCPLARRLIVPGTRDRRQNDGLFKLFQSVYIWRTYVDVTVSRHRKNLKTQDLNFDPAIRSLSLVGSDWSRCR